MRCAGGVADRSRRVAVIEEQVGAQARRDAPAAQGIRERGEIRTSAASGRVGWIDTRDIAESAGAVLGDPERDFDDEYVLTGPQALSYSDAAGIIVAETDRPVRVIDVDVDEVAAHLRKREFRLRPRARRRVGRSERER